MAKLTDIGYYFTVIALESNLGDFAIRGKSSNTNLGFAYIDHLEMDNQTITNLKYVDNIQGNGCRIIGYKRAEKGEYYIRGREYLH